MTSLKTRSRAEEQMDAADLDEDIYARVLDDLSRVNRWTLTARPTIGFLRKGVGPSKSFRLLDVGFGHGDMLRVVARWARRHGIFAGLVGVDLNAKSVAIARAATPSDLNIDYHEGRYQDLGGIFDFVVSSQVAHHMTDEQLCTFIRYMEDNARRGWLISDLHRHRFSHMGFPLLGRLMGVHRIVREDGQLSIARSFRPGEWKAILINAGIVPESTRIVRRFPFRLCVERLR